jgi:hypothetical protein
MATVYRRWLIAKGNTFCPGGEAIAKLVARLRKEHWIVDPASDAFRRLSWSDAPLAAKTGAFATHSYDVEGGSPSEHPQAGKEALPADVSGEWIKDPDRTDLVLSWPVRPGAGWEWGAASVRYPLTRLEASGSHVFSLQRGEDFIYPTSKCIDPVATECACGEDLAFEWDADEIASPFGDATGIFTECSDCSRTFDPSRHEAVVRDPLTGEAARVRGGAAHRFALVVDCGAVFPKSAPLPTFHPDLKALLEAEFGRDFYEVGAID